MKAHTTFSIVTAATVAIVSVEAGATDHVREYERTATVQAADLDLARERDARVLYDRIRYAARALCAAEEARFDVRKTTRRRRCMEDAIETAVERADAPLLMAVHLQQSEQLARL